MKEWENVLCISHSDSPRVISALLAVSDFKNEIEVGRSVFAILLEEGNFLFLEVTFWELSKIYDRVQDSSVFVVDTDVVIDGMISSFFWFSWEESALGLEWVEWLFAAELSVLIFKYVVSDKDDISDGEISGVVFDVFCEQEDVEFFVGEGWVDNFDFHAIIFFDIFSVGTGRVDNEAESRGLFVIGGLCLDFLEWFDGKLIWHSDEIFIR